MFRMTMFRGVKTCNLIFFEKIAKNDASTQFSLRFCLREEQNQNNGKLLSSWDD